jgi:hypothetical protein
MANWWESAPVVEPARRNWWDSAPLADAAPAGPSTVEDVAKSGASGIARGAMDLVGLPGTLADAMNAGGQFALRKGYELFTGNAPSPEGGVFERMAAGPTPEVTEALGGLQNPLSGAKFRGVASDLTDGATEYKPQTTEGKYASTIGEFLPAAATMGLNPSNLFRFGVLPGGASEFAGQMTEGTWAEPYARFAAALVAPAAVPLVKRAITPFGLDPVRSQAAQTLRAEGINPTAGQVTGNRTLKYAESELGGGKAAQMMQDQAEAFTSAAMKRAGGSGRATSDNMRALRDRLSQGFDDISARNTVRADPPLVTDMNRTIQEYGRVLPAEQRQIVSNVGQDIVDRFRAGGGSMTGRDYQSIRSRLSKRAQNARGSDNELADAWRGLRDALDDAMTRSVRPDDAAEWGELRRQWGNSKVLERAAVGGGEDAAMGLISPARLRQAAAQGNRGGYARGEGDFAELSKAGQTLLTPLPNSGTAPRTRMQNLGASLPTVLGAGVGGSAGGIKGGIIGAMAGAAAPYAAGRTLMSRPVQAYLANELLSAPRVADPRHAAIVAALLGQMAPQTPRLEGR